MGQAARVLVVFGLGAVALVSGLPMAAAAPSLQVGQCVSTRIASIGHRLDGMPDSGSALLLADGISQVSYDRIPGIQGSRRGDPVTACLVSVPQDCPAGDDRGRVYRTTNLRTGASWRLPDSEHLCGGA